MRKNGMFWAVLFISIGLIILLQNIFGINIPVVRILIGIFLVYIGLKMIFGSFGHRMGYFTVNSISTETDSVFSSNSMKAKRESGEINRKFSTVFGSADLDLRGLTEEDLKNEIKIDNAFGKTRVFTDEKTPIKARIDSGFASVVVRGQRISSFGEAEIQTPDYSSDKPALKLDINAAFGEVVVE